MKQVLVYTCAYNAEKTLKRTIESILAQTYSDWIYYIVDNGATDKTGAIINEYAAKDPRIIPLANKENCVWEPGNTLDVVIRREPKCDYFCSLDADDEYKPRFLETMLEFTEKNNLDIAACGYDFINASSNALFVVRCLRQNICLDKRGFSEAFSELHQFMRTYWAKLFSIPTLLKMDMTRIPSVPYGWDTLFTTDAFRCAGRVGILAESLHRYYLSPKSETYRWDSKRIDADCILDDMARSFLIDKHGAVSPKNDWFLHCVYLSSLNDTLHVLFSADLPLNEKIANLRDIITHEKTQKMLRQDNLTLDEFDDRLRYPVLKWLLSQNDALSADSAKEIANIVSAMYVELPPALDYESLCFIFRHMPELVDSLMIQEDYPKALDAYIAASQDMEIADEDVETYILLGVNLSAAAENADAYIYFKKVWMSYLVDCDRLEEAKKELNEFAQILPEDEDFAELGKRI